MEDLQIKEIQEISHKADIVEIIIQDQTQTDAITQIITEIVQTQTPERDIFQMIVLETPHTKDTETNQTVGTDNTKITNHETIQTIDQTLIIITTDHVKILKIEIQII